MDKEKQKKTNKFSMVVSIFVSTILFIFMCGILYGCAEEDDEKKEPHLSEITGIVVINNNFVYDGEAHGIELGGVLSTDEIYFSLDGRVWQDEEVLRVEPGEYLVFYKIIRSGYAEYINSTTLIITISRITGVVARDTVCILGRDITADITGVKAGDKLVFSVSGGDYSERIEVFDVGVYTVSYTLTRPGVGSVTGTFTLTVLPNIAGTYVGRGERIILTDTTAVIDGNEYDMSYRVDGVGQIDVNGNILEFIVDGNVLEMNGVKYTKIDEDLRLIELRINGCSYYAACGIDAVFEITFVGDCATVSVDGEALARFDGYNYCESVLGATELSRNYIDGTVEFAASVGFVDITLSLLPVESIEPIVQSVMYDGMRHGLVPEYENVLYYNDGLYEETPTTYIEVGEYEYTLIVLRDGYLPQTAEGRLTILPDLSGVYVAESVGVLEINGYEATINNVAVDFEPGLNSFVIDGKTAVYADGAITIDGTTFRRTEDNLMAVEIGGSIEIVKMCEEIEIRISDCDGRTRVIISNAVTGDELLVIEIAEKVTSVMCDGKPLLAWTDEFGELYLIIKADLVPKRVAWLTVNTAAFAA